MISKNAFISEFKDRTKKFAIDVIFFIRTLDQSPESKVIKYQLIKSVTSVGANYRAACISRSRKEFYSKISIVVEEADETLYWLEIISDLKLCSDDNRLKYIQDEGYEILKIVSSARQKVKSQAF